MLNKTSEFEVQALAYWNLKKRFPIVRGEYKIKKDVYGGRGARLDIAIFNTNEEMMLIIEVKPSKRSFSQRQSTTYSKMTGVPCIYIRGMGDAYHAVDIVKDFLKEAKIEIL
jgi:hypothetical protein